MIAVALAGGGERVVAWEAGVLSGLRVRPDVVLGTSAGALVAARFAAGWVAHDDVAPGPHPAAAFAQLAAVWEVAGETLQARRRTLGRCALAASPGGEEAYVGRVAVRVPPLWPAALRVAAIDADSGERVIFSRGDVARAVAASRAVPGLLPPVTIAGRRYVDGALGSATNADVLRGEVIVVAPLGDGPVDRLWREALEREVETLERDGNSVTVIDAAPGPLTFAAGRARAAQIRSSRAA
jgi:NTE family protein